MQRRTIKKIVLIAVTTIVLVVAGTAYWIGFFIEQQAGSVQEIRQIERGWFSSHIASSLELPDKTLPAVRLQHDIYHGPLPFISADTTLDNNSAWCDSLPALCDGEHPLLTSKIGLTGISHHRFDLPLLEFDAISGMLGIQQLNGELQIPLLANSPQGSLQTHLQNLIWTGNHNSETLKLTDLKLQSDLATENVYLNASLTLSAASIVYGTDQAGPGEIQLFADRIDYHLLHQLSIIWQRYRGPSPDFLLKLQEFLAKRPKITLIPSRLNTPLGDLLLDGKLSLHAVNMLKLLSQPLLIIDDARLNIQIGKQLLETIAKHNNRNIQQIEAWRQNGLLSLTEETYQTVLRIQEGRIYLNDSLWTGF